MPSAKPSAKPTAAKSPAAAEQQVTITPPDFRFLEFQIRGTTPLCISRFSAKALEQIKTTQEAGSSAKGKKAREPKDFERLFQDAKHISEEGWEGMHAAAFRNGAISACRAVGYKMTWAKLAFHVIADGFDRVDGAPLVRLTEGVAERWEAPVRNATGVVDIRCRPLYRQWGAKLRVRFDAGMLSATDLTNLIVRVGLQVGIGEGRPDSKASAGLGLGLFEVV